MRVDCDCGAKYEVPTRLLGQKLRCPRCGAVVATESSKPPPASPTPPPPNADLKPPSPLPFIAFFVLMTLLVLGPLLLIRWRADSVESDEQPETVAAPKERHEVAKVELAVKELVAPSPTSGSTRLPTSDLVALSTEDLVTLVEPAVLTIRTNLATLGSGFFVDDRGTVATNYHVIEGAREAEVELKDKSVWNVRGVWTYSVGHDLALVQIDTGGRKVPSLRLAQQPPRKGARVVAIGSPMGLTGSVSEGIVSSFRKIDERTLIQTTAPMNSGNSGGPLVDEHGAVVGVNTSSIVEGQNLNFAVSVDHVRELLATKPKNLIAFGDLPPVIKPEKKTGEMPRSDGGKAASAVWKALEADDLGTALRLLNHVPDSQRGKEYWRVCACVHEQLGNLKEAYVAYVEACKIEADSDILVDLGIVADQLSPANPNQGYFEAAREACEAAIRSNPGNARAYNLRGVLNGYFDDKGALGSFKTAIALDPKLMSAHYNLGMLHLRKDENSSAADAFREALRYVSKSKQYRLISRDSDSITACTTSSSVEVIICLALAHAENERGRFSDAIRIYQQVLAKEPKNALACWGIQMVYVGWRGNLKDHDAVSWEKRAEALDPGGSHYAALTFSNNSIHLFKQSPRGTVLP